MDSSISARELRIKALGADGQDEGIAVSIPSDLSRIEEVVEAVASRCVGMGLDRHTAEFNLRIALSEAIANAMMYGNGMDTRKAVEVEARGSNGRFSVVVRDEGCGFDPEVVPDPTTPERVRLPDGRGIFLIRQLVDEVTFSERGNAICMVLRQS